MPIEMHPEAIQRFSEEARQLLALLLPAAPEAENSGPPRGSRAHVPVVANLTLEDLVDGRWIEAHEDPFTGRLQEVVFRTPGADYRLDGEGAEKLETLADKVAGHTALNRTCGSDYVKARLLEWLHDSRADVDARPWMDVLLERFARDVVKRAILIPIDGMVIEKPLTLGPVVFDFFTAEYFDRSVAYIREHGKLHENDLTKMAGDFDRYRGVVYARLESEAELEWAKEHALEETETVLSCLRFFHPAALDARTHCPLGRLGGQSPHLLHFLEEREGVVLLTGSEARRWGRDFDLTHPEFRTLSSDGLARVDEILSDADRTQIEGRILQALILYSNGLLFEPVEQRLLHALVALESLLLRDTNEPILYTLTRRAAHMIGKALPQRREIVSILKDAYRLRSDFVHHGKRIQPGGIAVVNGALHWVWSLLYGLMIDPRVRRKDLRTKEQMLNEIDDLILT